MDLGEALQKGFYASLGATAALLEFWQDPIAREQSLQSWQQDLDQLVEKGVSAEMEARNFVDRMVARQTGAPTSRAEEPVPTTVDTTAQPAEEGTGGVPQDDAQALSDLTQQLSDLRAELERLRQR
ncbi:MAG: hypothetical protein HC918_14850 [Oscillatoriales cyanobacterium SM2_1_8]|nr:hypothetical protein [Oscillatoriales cyanobacterium SM2_1_8]